MLELGLIVSGGLLTLAACYSLGRLVFPSLSVPESLRFGIGAAILSHVYFLMLVAGATRSRYIVGVLVFSLIPLFVLPRPGFSLPERRLAWVFGPVALLYGGLYTIQALAPEIQPDAAGYHLGLVREWLLLNSFPERIGFYGLLPQGLETLFLPAYSIGQHSAAKLVHFAFLIATVPLLLATTRELGLPDWQGAVAAVFYACTPVVGTSGTTAYNDGALVFFVLATFYLLVRWSRDRRWEYLLLAGLAAGFCYSVKLTGLLIPALAGAYLLIRREWRGAAVLAGAAALFILPWMIRNAVWTGNPLAPLFNALFENPYFHIGSEQELAERLRSYDGVTPGEIPLELTVFGRQLQGLIGPVFLLAPVALLALRRRVGQLILLTAALLAIPWYLNVGARFVMPSLLFVSVALAMALPRRAAIGVALAHAVVSLPPVVSLYASPHAWTLRGAPVEAALRIQPEDEYLSNALWEYKLARLIDEHVPPTGSVFELFRVPSAYCDATVVGPWHSAAADRMRAALTIGSMTSSGVYTELDARWQEREITALRIRLAEPRAPEWSVHEVRLHGPSGPAASTLSAWPNIWDAPLSVDGNLITKWAAWEEARPDMYVQLNLGEPARVTGATVISPSAEGQREIEFLGQLADGRWVQLAERPNVLLHPTIDLRRSAMGVLKQNGVQHLVVPLTDSVFAGIGRSIVDEPAAWGVEVLGREAGVYLVRVL